MNECGVHAGNRTPDSCVSERGLIHYTTMSALTMGCKVLAPFINAAVFVDNRLAEHDEARYLDDKVEKLEAITSFREHE